MAIKLIDELIGMRFKQGNTTYEAVEIKFRDQVLWPIGTSYTIVTPVTWHWSQGSMLYANGSNRVWFSADVLVTTGGTTTTISDATLVPSLDLGTEYYIDDSLYVKGYNLGTTETTQYNERVRLSYGTASVQVSVYQEANVRNVVSTDYGSWTTISDTPTGNPYDYHVDISATQYTHQTSSDECSAAGGSTQLFFPSGTCYHLQAVNRTRTRTVTEYCTYTATGSTVHTEPQPNETQTNIPWIATIEDTPAVTIVSGDTTAFHLNTSTFAVTIDSRGTITGSQRSMTFRATNSNVTADVTVYQEANVATTTYVYDLSIVIDYNGNLPYTSGNYGVTGCSKRTPTTTYTSQAPPEIGYPQSTPSTISVENCTAHDGNNNPITSVSGEFGFALGVTQNGSSQRTVRVTITADADNTETATASKTQDAEPAQPYIAKAELLPFIANFNAGNFVNGKTYTMFTITGSHNTSSATLQDVWLKYRVNNSIDYSVRIGELQVSEQSSSDLPELIPYSGYTLPTFKAGETYGYNDTFRSGDTVYAWFTVGNKGIIDELDTYEDNPYYISIT